MPRRRIIAGAAFINVNGFSAVFFFKWNNFNDFLFAFLWMKPLRKGICCKRKEFAPSGLIGLEFDSPVNTIKIISSRSVYVITLFLGRLSPQTVLSTSLGKTFLAWLFILNENLLFWLTISYQKPFVFSFSVLCSQIVTLKLIYGHKLVWPMQFL